MFFGAIASGCDLTGGWGAFNAAERHEVGIMYKEMSMEFRRRVDGDLSLCCEDTELIEKGKSVATLSSDSLI